MSPAIITSSQPLLLQNQTISLHLQGIPSSFWRSYCPSKRFLSRCNEWRTPPYSFLARLIARVCEKRKYPLSHLLKSKDVRRAPRETFSNHPRCNVLQPLFCKRCLRLAQSRRYQVEKKVVCTTDVYSPYISSMFSISTITQSLNVMALIFLARQL